MKPIYLKALICFNLESRKWALIEEMGEVMQALNHEKRNRTTKYHVIQELVDLQLTLNMLKANYVLDSEWNKLLNIAEDRLDKKINAQRGIII